MHLSIQSEREKSWVTWVALACGCAFALPPSLTQHLVLAVSGIRAWISLFELKKSNISLNSTSNPHFLYSQSMCASCQAAPPPTDMRITTKHMPLSWSLVSALALFPILYTPLSLTSSPATFLFLGPRACLLAGFKKEAAAICTDVALAHLFVLRFDQ